MCEEDKGMNAFQADSFNDLVECFPGGRVPEAMAGRISLPDLPQESRRFIFRMFSLMLRAAVPATEIIHDLAVIGGQPD